jgi:Rod binding domain-containing protein
MSLSAIATPADILKPAPSIGEANTREKIAKASKDFEASYLSIMLGQMFEGVGEGEFSGGQGEAMFKSFMTDAIAKKVTRSGGVGLAAPVQREMLKLQGLE